MTIEPASETEGKNVNLEFLKKILQVSLKKS